MEGLNWKSHKSIIKLRFIILNIIRILVCCYGNDDVVKKLHGENRFSMVMLMALINGCAIRLKKSPLEEIDVQSGHLL